MADSTADARQQIADARHNAQHELDALGGSARAAIDIPAKVKRHPVETVGVVGGTAFMLLGGPKRVAKAAEQRLFPAHANRPPTLLPKEVDKTIKRLPEEDREQVRAHLERDFANYLKREHAQEPTNARQSFWKTYDTVFGIFGAAATRELVKRLFAVPDDAEKEQANAEQQANAMRQSGATGIVNGAVVTNPPPKPK
jgi:hypothetical protein